MQLVSQSTYTHDAKGRIENISHANAIGEFLATYDYEWDMADQLLEWTHHGQTTNYAHDDAGQLTSADSSALPDENYAYDLNGNRDNPNITVGDHNQLLADETYDYTYDAEGNLISKTERSTGTLTTYAYDHRNRLTSAETYSSGGILLSEVSFTYDLFDRRIAQTVNGQLTHFVYDGNNVWADFDSSGQATSYYLFGDAPDEILARSRPIEGTAFYLTDHLGTVRDLTDSTGTLRSTLTYDSFGRVLSSTDPTFSDRYQFTAREYIPELELYYYRARFYDPATGRFLSQDPIGFNAGDANLYRYVFNAPLHATDAFGKNLEYAVSSILTVENLAIAGLSLTIAMYFYLALDSLDFPDVLPNLDDLPFIGPDVLPGDSNPPVIGPDVLPGVSNPPILGPDVFPAPTNIPVPGQDVFPDPSNIPVPGIDVLVGGSSPAVIKTKKPAQTDAPIRGAVSETTGAVTNLGTRTVAANADLFAKLRPGDGMSGVFDHSTGTFILRNSENVPIGPLREGWVRQYGGHADVRVDLGHALGENLSQATRGRLSGFSLSKQADGTISFGWNSGMINSASHGNRAVPEALRSAIEEAVRKALGL